MATSPQGKALKASPRAIGFVNPRIFHVQNPSTQWNHPTIPVAKKTAPEVNLLLFGWFRSHVFFRRGEFFKGV